MRKGIVVQPSDLRDYAKALGWKQRPEGINDRLYVMENEQFPRRQLVFPMDPQAPDFAESIDSVTDKLASMYARDPDSIVAEVITASDDTLRFRVITRQAAESSLPLNFVSGLVTGAQQMLLSSACTVLKPQLRHPRLSRMEAQQLLDSSRFGHTEEGSFVLKVSCPVNAVDVQATLFPDMNAPFVRQATLAISDSLGELVKAIEQDRVDQFVDDTKTSARPLLSSNLCEAFNRFYDEDLITSVDVSMTWAASFPRPDGQRQTTIRVQRSYFPKIEEIGRELRSNEVLREDTFIGTVERLDGNLDDSGRRSGEVIIAVLQEDEIIRVRMTLAADEYASADRAHMTAGAYVRMTGKLQPGRQPRAFRDVTRFELMLPADG